MRQILITSIFIVIFPSFSFGCLTLARTINLQNSPFFFDSFGIAGHSFSFTSADGEQKIQFGCENDSGNNKWKYSMSAGNDPGEDEVRNADLPEGAALNDTDEVPLSTRIGPFSNGAQGATFQVTSKKTDKYLAVTCVDEPNRMGHKRIVVELKDGSGTLGRMEAVMQKGLRGFGNRGESETIDFSSGNMANLNIGGCGVNSNDFSNGGSQTPGVNQ